MRLPGPSTARSAYLREFIPRSIPASLVTGLILGLMELFFGLSFASLIFRESLAASLPQGMGLALVSTASILIVVGLTSSRPGTFGVIQDVPAVLLAVIAGQVVTTLNPAAALPTVLTLMAFTGLCTGGVLVVIGQLKLGGLVRYMPYPVVGGFIAATGWLLITGSIPIMTGVPLTLAGLPVLFQPAQLPLWLPGILIAAVIFPVMRFSRHPLGLPAVLIGALTAYYLILFLTGISLAEAATLGFFSANQITLFWSQPAGVTFLSADWGAILRQSGNIAVLAGMTMVGLLLNISATELIIGREFDLNHELRSTGLANLLSGLLGGYVGYHTVGNTAIATRVGVRDRVTPVFAGLVILAAVFFHLPVLHMVPKAMFAGVLLALGLDFLFDWVIAGWKRFSFIEYVVMLLILIVIVLTDYLTGVVIGLLAMVILFAVGYSRTRVILRSYTIGEVFSTVNRSARDSLLLEQYGRAAQVYELQGFLFFGTANVVLDAVKQRLAQPTAPSLALLLIDFNAVTGIDSSAALSFQKTWQRAEESCFKVVLTGASPQVKSRLNFMQPGSCPAVQVFPDLDHGLEWAEDQILTHHPQPEPVDAGEPVPDDEVVRTLIKTGLSPEMAARAAAYVTPIELAADESLMHKGDPADGLFFLGSGQVSIYRETQHGPARARTLGPGSILGEIALYLNQPRTADVRVDRPSRLFLMQRSTLEQIRQEDPALSAALHEMIAYQMAVRLRKDEQGIWILRG